VKVDDSIVTLTGFAHSYPEKQRAEEAVMRVGGVSGVANDIEVRLSDGEELTDPEIARAAVAAIRTDVPAASDSIKVLVHHGYITLQGTVEWNYLKEFAEHAVHRLRGVMGVINSIGVQPTVRPAEIKRRIEDAFRRSAQIDANQITVDAQGGEVTLHGRVRSWMEREGHSVPPGLLQGSRKSRMRSRSARSENLAARAPNGPCAVAARNAPRGSGADRIAWATRLPCAGACAAHRVRER